jgi:hypothetical protein
MIDKEVNTINKINFNFILIWGLFYYYKWVINIDNSSVKVSPLTLELPFSAFCPFILPSQPRKISPSRIDQRTPGVIDVQTFFKALVTGLNVSLMLSLFGVKHSEQPINNLYQQ